MALFEKNFGVEVISDAFVSAEDLMSLQSMGDILAESFAAVSCSVCSFTCATTAQK
jgi:hypothetical protein